MEISGARAGADGAARFANREELVSTPNVYSHAPPPGYIAAVQAWMPAPVNVWNTSSAPPTSLTYTFEITQPPDQTNVYLGWTPFTEAQKAAVRSVLAEYESFINVKFAETVSPAADVEFGRVNLSGGEGGEGGYHYAYVTSTDGTVTYKKLVDYALFDNRLAAIPRNTILHELGHAMTLKHPGNYDAGGATAPGPYLPATLDNNKYSVMAYGVDPDNHARSNHLMLLDIAALQARFGANLSYHTGNDIYTGPQGGGIQVIWDAGGNDTISGAGRAKPVTINLNDGTFSSLGAKDNLAIAYGTIIENAVGGRGNDRLIGNHWDNLLSGGPGNDTIIAGTGNDTLIGGPGKDLLIGGPGNDTFVFNARLNAKTNVDTIRGFAPGVDTIELAHTVFKALVVGALPAEAFFAGAAAHTAAEHVIYNSHTGALIYDSNGSAAGGAVQFAKLAAGLALHASDFLVV